MNAFSHGDAWSALDYYDLITGGFTDSAEVAYDLLKQKLLQPLRRIYDNHGFGIDADFEDTLDDFFLYLYEGSSSNPSKPFALLDNVRDKKAFFGWTLSTYRHFLFNKAREENKRKALLENARQYLRDEEKGLSEEDLIHILADAIAYADQKFPQRSLFVLYRMMLSFLDHSRAIPQEMMAHALDMHPVTYRVCTKRQKDKLLDYILLREAGNSLELDATHQQMRDRIIAGFNQLYELLIEYYDLILDKLPAGKKIQALRREYGRDKGKSMHETLNYGIRGNDDIHLFYRELKQYLTGQL